MEESPSARFRAFSARAREQGLALLNRQDKRVFVLHFSSGSLTILAEPTAVAGLVRLAADREIRPSYEFITELLDLRIERTELEAESGHYVWRELFETTSRVSLGDWMQAHGYPRRDLKSAKPPPKAESPSVDDATKLKSIRDRLIEYWIFEGSADIDVLEEEDEAALRAVVVARVVSFSDAHMLRLYALDEEQRDWADQESERIERDLIVQGRGSDMPPSPKDLCLERALSLLAIETKLDFDPPDSFGRDKEDDDD